MNKVIFASLTALLALGASAHASIETDIKEIRTLLPAGTDVAQVQFYLMNGSTEADAFDSVKANYLIRDINGDGIEDVLVISEEQPHFENWETNQPCGSASEDNCQLAYGKRAMLLFYGQGNGVMKLAFSNKKMVLGADEGGVFGDPLEGFSVKKNGSIQYAVYGGSSWRWSYTDTLQFRNGDFYVIGYDDYAGWTGDLRADTKSINLITGRVLETHQKNGDAPTHTKIYHVAVKPLVKVADFEGSSAN